MSIDVSSSQPWNSLKHRFGETEPVAVRTRMAIMWASLLLRQNGLYRQALYMDIVGWEGMVCSHTLFDFENRAHGVDFANMIHTAL